jgi:hypothetical protein
VVTGWLVASGALAAPLGGPHDGTAPFVGMQLTRNSQLIATTAALQPQPAATPTPTPDADPAAPPKLPPRKPGFVVATHLGTQVFTGAFGSVAPPAFLSRLQVGYEPARWAMLYAEGELAFASTARAQIAPSTRAFPILGAGGGLRITVGVTERVGVYGEFSTGVLLADVPYNALTILGFRAAESLSPYYGLRLGTQWLQQDRHFAITFAAGYRRIPGFARSTQTADNPGVVDLTLGLRYTL